MISIIVPIYNEENGIVDFIESLKRNISNNKAELIFVDGGSTDNTVPLCVKNNVQVHISAEKGRASQMNYGAEQAQGEVYYFLHSDSFPPKNFINDIYENIEKGFCCGCYRLSFKPDHFLLRSYSWFTRFDVDLFRFGDQSLFVKRKAFEEVGGFDERLKVMEDQQIVKDLKKMNNFVIMNKSVVTSSRKYRENGVFKLQLIFAIIVLLYYLKVSQETIAHFYSKQI